jgi:hypothetical protein
LILIADSCGIIEDAFGKYEKAIIERCLND